MKLKFRAEPKDVLIFVIFCVVLLYIVAFVELNVLEFASSASFHGLNPLPAFAPDLFVPTMIFWIISLIAIILSVSNYFWDNDSGFGFAFNKKEKEGYSRWLKAKEMKKELVKVDPKLDTIPYGGVPIINNDKEVYVDNSEYHSLVIGSTGSGKTQGFVQPLVTLLAKAGESMIITDPKGEIYRDNGELLKEKGYNIVILNFRDPNNGNAWNPLTTPYELYTNGNQDKASELLEDLGLNIIHDEKESDPFWQNASSDFFVGLSLGLFADAKREEININSIYSMAATADEMSNDRKNMKLNVYFSFKDRNDPSFLNVSAVINTAQSTKAGVLSTFKQKIKIYASRDNISEMLSYSDFDMEDIGKKKTAVFLIVHDEKKTYHALVTVFIKQCYESLIGVAQKLGGKLPNRTNFILDEFANMPAIKDIDTMITAARSRKIRLNFIIQNFAQLEQVYGKNTAETIKGNCGNIIYLISSELAALEEISKLAGEKESKKDEKTSSTPLVTVSDLQRLKMYDIIILRTRQMPFQTKVVPFYKTNKEGKWGKHYPPCELPTREKKKVEIFDIDKFLAEKQGNQTAPAAPNQPRSLEDLIQLRNSMQNSSSSENPSKLVQEIKNKRLEEKLKEANKQEEINKRLEAIKAAKEQQEKVKKQEDEINKKLAAIQEEENKKKQELMTAKMKSLEEKINSNIKKENEREVKEAKLPKANIINDVTSKPKKEKIIEVKKEPVKEVVEENTNFISDDEFLDDFFDDGYDD